MGWAALPGPPQVPRLSPGSGSGLQPWGWEDGRHRSPPGLGEPGVCAPKGGELVSAVPGQITGTVTLPCPFVPREVPGRQGGREQGAVTLGRASYWTPGASAPCLLQ